MREHRIFAACYDVLTAPMERAVFAEQRRQLLADVTGTVLDVGAGTGANFSHYPASVVVVAAEPDGAMRRRLSEPAAAAAAQIEISDASATDLPFADGTFDAVVCGLVLCTIDDVETALAELDRVLAPDGRLIVLEHVRGSGRHATWQDRVTPLWRRIVAGCHPNRDTRSAVESAGFSWQTIEEFELTPRWVPTSPILSGIAQRRAG